MERIEEKDIQTLKKKSLTKKVCTLVKRSVLAIVSVSLAVSLATEAEIVVAKSRFSHDEDYSNTLILEGEERKTAIKELFESAINNNPYIDEEYKVAIINEFTRLVINNHYEYFTDEVILNMCAVASTEKVIVDPHMVGTTGTYNPFVNTLSFRESIEEMGTFNKSVFAHEQLHAILRTSMFTSGYTIFGISGAAFNEGMTSMSNMESTYNKEQDVLIMLGRILNDDSLWKNYFESDFGGLKTELAKYVSMREVEEFMWYIDFQILKGRFNRHIPSDSTARILQMDHEKKEFFEVTSKFLVKVFEGKYGMKMSEHSWGKLIMESQDGKYMFDVDDTNYEFTWNIRYLESENRWRIIFGWDGRVMNDYFFSREEIEDVDFDAMINEVSEIVKNVQETGRKF